LSVASAALFGLLPAWRSARSDPYEGLKSNTRSNTDTRQGGRIRSILVALEVGLSTVCLLAGGLLLNSFVHLMKVDRGFDVERITTVDLNLPRNRYPDTARRAEFLRKLVEQAQAIPGVSSAAISNVLPLTAEGNNNIFVPEGHTGPILS